MNLLLCLQRASLFGVAALAVALVLQWVLANRVPASWRVWIWRAALIQTALALIPLAPLAISVLPTRAPIVATPTKIEAPPLPVSNAPALETPQQKQTAPIETLPPALLEAPDFSETPKQTAPLSKTSQWQWRETLPWIYLLGVAIQLALFARSAVCVRRRIRACTPIEDATLSARLHALAARLKISRVPRLLRSGEGSPFLTGILRPTIVLPQSLDDAHLDAVLAHELAHQRRKDLAWNTLLWALQTLLWFHPLSWISRRFHALEIESACDELTLKLTQIAPKSYGALLIGAEKTPVSPLTAGVNDNFFALQTRLKRLGRAPMQPRRRTAWLLSAALLVSFMAVVPVELTARAQNEAPRATESQSLRGTVRDVNGKSVDGAKVYIMQPMDDGGDPMAQTQTDANGKFALDKLKIDQYGVVVFVDAGGRGVTEKQFDLKSADDANNFAIKLPQQSVAILMINDQKMRFLKGVEVQLFRVGNSFNSWMAMPRAVKARYRVTTDDTNIIQFPPLPLGMLAQFQLADEISKPTQFGLGDLRGGKWAPLAAEDSLRLDHPKAIRTILLAPPTRLEGRVTLEDGSAKGNVLILARRINSAEAGGKTEQREQLIAQTRSNAQGRYVMDGLHPGRYYVWVYPEKQLVKDYIGPSYERDLNDKTNRVNFKLSRGAIIQGVVVSKNTGKPVKGQTMWLFDSQENNQYVITDARGYFKFRALGGRQRLRVHKNGSNSPPPGFRLPAQSEFNFTIQNGQKRDFKIELLGQMIVQNTKPIRGVVVGPDEKSIAGATVFYYDVSGYIYGSQKVITDASGHFVLPAKAIKQPIRLFADKDELTTPQGTVAVAGQTVQLKLAANAWASVAGRVLDEKMQPIAGAKLSLTTIDSGGGQTGRFFTTDARGAYRYDHLRSNFQLDIRATKAGYTEGWSTTRELKVGQHVQSDIKMQRAPKTLAGILYGLDGKPAQNYNLWVSGQSSSVTVKKDGRFFFPQVPVGKVEIRVASTKDMGEMYKWKPFKAMGGDQKVVLRLQQRDPRFKDLNLLQSSIKPEALVGKVAPPIRATQWSGNRALALSQLRGKPVLLTFISPFSSTVLRDFARTFPNIQVIGVQLKLEGLTGTNWNSDANNAAQKWGFPIAVDAAVPSRTKQGGQTFNAYGNAPYAVIGRDGRVLYAGNQLDRSIELATAPN